MATQPGTIGVRQVADLLGVHENTVRNWSDQGLIPFERHGAGQFRRYPTMRIGEMLRSGILPPREPEPPWPTDEALAAADDQLHERLDQVLGALDAVRLEEAITALRNVRAAVRRRQALR